MNILCCLTVKQDHHKQYLPSQNTMWDSSMLAPQNTLYIPTIMACTHTISHNVSTTCTHLRNCAAN